MQEAIGEIIKFAECVMSIKQIDANVFVENMKMSENNHFYFFLYDKKNNYFTYFKQELVMFFLARLYGQIASVFIGNYKGKDFVESKKCMNCIRRVDIEKHRCPYCGSLYFHINGN